MENLCLDVHITSFKCVLFLVVLPKSKSPYQVIDVSSDDLCLSLSGIIFISVYESPLLKPVHVMRLLSYSVLCLLLHVHLFGIF